MRTAPPDDERTRIAVPEDDDRTRIAPQLRKPPSEDDGAETLIMTKTATTLASSSGASSPASATPGPNAPQPQTTSASSPHNAFQVGTKIGEFEILGIVGEGGFGIVYLAHDHSLDRKVALKEYMPAQLAQREGGTVVMRSDRHAETFAAGLRSFINEARLLAQFDHHSLVKVYRFWEANGTAYMVMPFYEGTTLKRTLKDLGTAPDEAWLKTQLEHLLDALETIHNRQCYHRDIAPDNILILPDGSPLLLDFGAARRVIGEQTQALTVILKPGYAPIEQYAEVPNMKQGPWTDLYALASVVYFAITGKAPVPSVARVMSDPLVPLTKTHAGRYSESFLKALDWALAVKPEERPQNIAEFRRGLGLPEREPTTRFIPAPRDVTPAPSDPAPRTQSKVPTPTQTSTPAPARKALALGGAVLVAAAIGGYFAFSSTDRPRVEPAPKSAAAPAPTAPTPEASAADVNARVKEALAGYECARLDAAVDGGAALIRGHVGSEGDLQKLRSAVAGVKGITRVDASAVHIAPGSYCGVVAALTPHAAQAGGLPSIGLKNGATVVREGDKLVVEATAGNFPGFVYADLYDQEGNVVHLLPNAKEKKNEIHPGQRVVLGDDPMFGMQWDVVPPLGKHLLVVTVSRTRLFDRSRTDVEPATKYLGVYGEALKKPSQEAVTNYQFVDFSPRR